jgi:hypothetical protein
MTSRVMAGALMGAAAWCAAVLLPAPAYSHKPITTNILFKNEIAQIFQRKCFQCHSENNLAMSLTTYTEARPWARAIREEILERKMPPWQAVPGYGHFANDISLNTREKEIILSWTDGGAPSGVLRAEEGIPPVYVAPIPLWDHGQPDIVLPVGEQRVTGGAAFETRRVVIDTRLPAPRRVRAIGLKQGDRRVVRHAAFYDAATGRWLGGWTPWQTLSAFADDVQVALPANARIAVEIGYSGSDADVVDTSEVGLYFATGQGAAADAFAITATESRLAAGTRRHRVRAETKLAANTRVLAFWPEPGVGATSVEVAAVSPEGMTTPLLWIADYRADWPAPYLLSSGVDLPRGSRLITTTYFDNASDAPLAAKPRVWVASAGSRPAAAPRK